MRIGEGYSVSCITVHQWVTKACRFMERYLDHVFKSPKDRKSKLFQNVQYQSAKLLCEVYFS